MHEGRCGRRRADARKARVTRRQFIGRSRAAPRRRGLPRRVAVRDKEIYLKKSKKYDVSWSNAELAAASVSVEGDPAKG